MGLFSFIRDAGKKIEEFAMDHGIIDDSERYRPSEDPTERAAERAEQARVAAEHNARRLRSIINGLALGIEDANVSLDGSKATITGRAQSTEQAHKAVVTVGNINGIDQVDDQIEVVVPTPPPRHRTVVRGDTLSKIAGEEYGDVMLYPIIFAANRPMLRHPDEIFPGQVLLIPPEPSEAPPVEHTVERGETLGTIAKKYYGNARRYTDIFEANRDQLSDPNSVAVGQVLKIKMA